MKTAKQIRREAKQLFRLCLVEGFLDETRARKTVKQVLDSKCRGGLTLLSHFQHLVKLERAQRSAQVASASTLPPAFQTKVAMDLERMYGPRLNTSFVLDPSLIGGVRIQVASDVYDASVRAELASLLKNF